MGGAVLVIAGIIVSNQINTNEQTGELTRMVQIQWFGTTHYIVVHPDHELGQIANNTHVMLGMKQSKGKNGWYNSREEPIRILTIGGKPVPHKSEAA